MTSTAPHPTGFDPAALQRLLDGRYAQGREQVRDVLCRPEFAPVAAPPTAEYRRRVLEWAQTLAGEGLTAPGFPEEFGGHGDPGANVVAFETLAYGDLSLLVKFGVQFGLFGGAVQQLGTSHHHERYLERIAALELPGCFAMTEAAHGSDVQHLETTATYDPEAQQFVVETPSDDAHKEYIGNAACDGRLAVVFAQLSVGGESHGVHALLVPIRRARRRLRWRADRGLRREDGTKRRRQRAAVVRRRPGPARGAAQPLRERHARGPIREPDREREQALLHDARDARSGARVRVRGVGQRG